MGGPIGITRAGAVLGSVVGGWHLCWSALVAAGVAQTVIDFVFWMHFIKPIYVIEPFEPVRAVILIVVTALFGFVAGSAFAIIWNASHKT